MVAEQHAAASASASAASCACTPTAAKTSTEIEAGEIAATVGLKNTFTGDTLCDENKPVVLEAIKFPEPVISVAIEPKTKDDQDRMGEVALAARRGRPDFPARNDQETGQTIISGMGELHLEVIVDRMLREFNVHANVGRPEVAYKETIQQIADAEGRFVRQTGGRGQFGVVEAAVEPVERGTGFQFENKMVGGSIPRSTSARRRAGHPRGARDRHSRRLSGHRRQGAACGWVVSPCRLVRDGVQDGGLPGDPGSHEEGATPSFSSPS